jgi:zinc D-Ala-D-Ala dipeptidase
MKYVDVSEYGFVIEPRYYYYGWSRSDKVLGRAGAVQALIKAKRYLPKGWNFKIWDMQRPRYVQIQMIESFHRRLKVEHPDLTAAERGELVLKFAAKPLPRVTRLDTHRNGGAIDLTVIDNFEEEIPMGTDHDDLTDKAATDYFEKLTHLGVLGKVFRDNRRILCEAMRKAGFENFSEEWWHWSIDK